MEYITERSFKVPDGVNPKFYTMISFKIPKPAKYNDPPIIIATLHNSQKSIFLTFDSVDNLNVIFNLDRLDKSLKQQLMKGLQKASQRNLPQPIIEKIK